MTVRGWQLAADWTRAGTYGAIPLEDVSSYLDDDSAPTVTWGRVTETDADVGPPTAPAGTLEFGLLNHGRQFSPENPASPLFGMILEGAEIRLQRTVSASTYTLFEGPLNRYKVRPNYKGNFDGEAMDAWGRPRAEKLSTALYTSVRSGDAINIVLDAIGWVGGRSIDVGASVFPYWWEDGRDAGEAIEDIVRSEGYPAIAFVKGGTFYFHDRHHRLMSSDSQTTKGLFTHIEPANSGPAGDFKMLTDTFDYDVGRTRIYNAARFSVVQRQPGETGHVWTTEDPLSLAANEVLPVWVQPSEPFFNAVTPVTDDGLDVTAGSVTASLSRTSGASLVMTLTAGGSGASIVGIQLTAVPIVAARTVIVSSENPGSIAFRGRLTWPDELPWCNVYDATIIASRLTSIYGDNRPRVTFTIENLDATYETMMLQLKPGDRITVRNDIIGLNEDFIVEGGRHTVTRFDRHQLQLWCEVPEPSQPSNAFTFDVAGKGFDQGRFGVDGLVPASTVFQFDVSGHGFDQGVFGA